MSQGGLPRFISVYMRNMINIHHHIASTKVNFIVFFHLLQRLHTVKNLAFALTKATSCSHCLSDDNLESEVIYVQVVSAIIAS